MKRKWDKWLKWKIGAVASLGLALLFHEVKASPQFADASAKSGTDSGDKLAAATAPETDPFATLQPSGNNSSSGTLDGGSNADDGRFGGRHAGGRRRFSSGSSGTDQGSTFGQGDGSTFSQPSTPSAPSASTGTQTRTTRS